MMAYPSGYATYHNSVVGNARSKKTIDTHIIENSIRLPIFVKSK